MPQRSSNDKPEKNPAAVAVGRLGGLRGGKARAKKLTPEERSEIAKKAAGERWTDTGNIDTTLALGLVP